MRIVLIQEDSGDIMNKQLTNEMFENEEENIYHTPYSEELAVLRCVKEGDVNKLEKTYRLLPKTVYGNMSEEPLKQLFYGSIANVTLVTRYAIEGGLDEETAFTMSDMYIKKMEQARTCKELDQLNEDMGIDFTETVRESRDEITSYPRVIRKCLTYLRIHRHENVSLEELGSEAGLSPKYLSALFRNVTGERLHAYQLRKRLEEAEVLLRYSDMSYSEISQSLGFSSQSHFTSALKRHTGVTPRQYRENRI